MALTVGQAAGLISSIVIILQLTFPLAIVFILAGLLADRNNAATWSVVGKVFNGSYWPSILRTDTATTTNVSKRTYLTSMFSTACVMLLAAAAVVTPLGLHESNVAKQSDLSQFQYCADETPFGLATPARYAYNTSRLCESILASVSCPGQYHGISMYSNATGDYINVQDDNSYISTVPPDNLTDIFSSGRAGGRALVASPFDIQYRTYTVQKHRTVRKSVLIQQKGPSYNYDQGRRYTRGDFKTYDTFVLSDDYVIQEGVLADMKNGGIAFRNHTLPGNVQEGMEWTESLLWLEPETACIRNNLTIQFTIPLPGETQVNELVDDGGFALLTTQYPYIDLNRTQLDAKLFERARKGAVLLNHNLRKALGLTASNASNVGAANTSYIGRRFLLDKGSSLEPGSISLSTFDTPLSPLSQISPDPRLNVTMLKSINLVVQGYGGMDNADDGMIAVNGGLMLASPAKLTETDNIRWDPGTNWSAPLFSCATAIRARIVDVTFFVNGSAELKNLRVRSVVPQTYENKTAPLWAIEKTGLKTGMVQPLWGIVDDKYENASFLQTFRRDYAYLPAGSGSLGFGLSPIDAWAGEIPVRVLGFLYSSMISLDGYKGYTGAASWPLKQKWISLSKQTTDISKILALIWTDIMINGAIGTRGQLNAKYVSAINDMDRKADASAQVQGVYYVRQLSYNLVYATPAIIFLSIYAIVIFTALGFWICRKSTFHLLRSLLNQTSTGRAVTMERYQDDKEKVRDIKTMGSRAWVAEFGAETVEITKTAIFRERSIASSRSSRSSKTRIDQHSAMRSQQSHRYVVPIVYQPVDDEVVTDIPKPFRHY